MSGTTVVQIPLRAFFGDYDDERSESLGCKNLNRNLNWGAMENRATVVQILLRPAG
ncbi:hypothetical protein [Natrialba sp. INN-245]|uniref:hypothetical protein n=1 Tax=Natrialba sp. INN-245 TaxID=2690967 RepID=UPI0013584BE1|nr:hypothetical protein [Natrialba sp. INN-245]